MLAAWEAWSAGARRIVETNFHGYRKEVDRRMDGRVNRLKYNSSTTIDVKTSSTAIWWFRLACLWFQRGSTSSHPIRHILNLFLDFEGQVTHEIITMAGNNVKFIPHFPALPFRELKVP